MSIEELKQRFIDGSLEKGIFTTHNELMEDQIITVGPDGFRISTSQYNGWLRINTYTYEPSTERWTTEETYEK